MQVRAGVVACAEATVLGFLFLSFPVRKDRTRAHWEICSLLWPSPANTAVRKYALANPLGWPGLAGCNFSQAPRVLLLPCEMHCAFVWLMQPSRISHANMHAHIHTEKTPRDGSKRLLIA